MIITYPYVIHSPTPLFSKMFFGLSLIVFITASYFLIYPDIFFENFEIYSILMCMLVIISTISGLLFFQYKQDYKYKKYIIHEDTIKLYPYSSAPYEEESMREYLGIRLRADGNPRQGSHASNERYSILLIHQNPQKTFRIAAITGKQNKDDAMNYVSKELGLKIIDEEPSKALKLLKHLNTIIAAALGLGIVIVMFMR